MGLGIKGKVATSGYQGNQGMAKGPAAYGGKQKNAAVVNNGVSAKLVSKTMGAKSKKKKVIVNALLSAMRSGHMSKQLSNSGNMNKTAF